MCRSRVSHGRIVPSESTSMFANVPWTAVSGQPRYAARIIASNLAYDVPASAGGASTLAHDSQSSKRSRS